jgi:hypothetical protein
MTATFTKYKLEERGGLLEFVSAPYTSQRVLAPAAGMFIPTIGVDGIFAASPAGTPDTQTSLPKST